MVTSHSSYCQLHITNSELLTALLWRPAHGFFYHFSGKSFIAQPCTLLCNQRCGRHQKERKKSCRWHAIILYRARASMNIEFKAGYFLGYSASLWSYDLESPLSCFIWKMRTLDSTYRKVASRSTSWLVKYSSPTVTQAKCLITTFTSCK